MKQRYIRERQAQVAKLAWEEEIARLKQEKVQTEALVKTELSSQVQVQQAQLEAIQTQIQAYERQLIEQQQQSYPEYAQYGQYTYENYDAQWTAQEQQSWEHQQSSSRWEQCYDDQGYVYYYNVDTGETSWTSPVVNVPDQYNNVPIHNGDPYASYDDTHTDQYTNIPESSYTHTDGDPYDAPRENHVPESSMIPTEDPTSSGVGQNTEEEGRGIPAEGYNLPSPWEEVYDEENEATYYYNHESSESSWERPEVSKEVKQEPDKRLREEDRKPNCWKCERLSTTATGEDIRPAIKSCYQCPKYERHYCASCFVTDHRFGLRRAHHFCMLSDSLRHSDPANPRLSDTVNSMRKPSDTIQDEGRVGRFQRHSEPANNEPIIQCGHCPEVAVYECTSCESSRHWYCHSCFEMWHETDDMMNHDRLHFRRGAPRCSQCLVRVAQRHCPSCPDDFCPDCAAEWHASGSRTSHVLDELNVRKVPIDNEGGEEYCIECDLVKACRLCNLCGDGYCVECFDTTHARGNKQQHTYLDWTEVLVRWRLFTVDVSWSIGFQH